MTKKFKFLEFSEPVPRHTITNKNNVSDFGVAMEIDLDDLIDWYSYHDAPRAVTAYFTYEDIVELMLTIQKVIKSYHTLWKGEQNDISKKGQ